MKSSILIAMFATASACVASDLQSDIQQLTGDAAKGYVAPLTSAIGSDLNLGYFNHAPNPDLWGIDVQAGLIIVGSSFTDTKTFSAAGNVSVNETMAKELAKQMVAAQGVVDSTIQAEIAKQLTGQKVGIQFSGPTSVGSSKEDVMATVTSSATVSAGGKTYNANGFSTSTGVSGLKIPSWFIGIPLFYPQINVGTVAGTQVAFRGFPGKLPAGDIGDISFWGLGINHNPGFWHEKENYLPLGINSSVTATYTSLAVGDIFSWSGWSLGLLASRKVGFRFLNVTPYAGLGMESSTLELKYQYDAGVPGVPPVDISIEQDGDAFLYLNGGLGLRLGIFNFDLGGKYSSNPGLNLGVNFAI